MAILEFDLVLELKRSEFQKLCKYSKSKVDTRGHEKGKLLMFSVLDTHLKKNGFNVDKGYNIRLGEPTIITGEKK